MRPSTNEIGFWSGIAASAAALAYGIVQVAQIGNLLRFPVDEILIYATSLGIVVPFLLLMLALHHLTGRREQFWTHGALLFTVAYAIFVSANYVVQLATVIPSKLRAGSEVVRILEQTPHSLFWNFDALGYIAMGLATLFAAVALKGPGLEKWARLALLAHAMVTPLIIVVYFHPAYSPSLLLLGAPWAITAPIAMLLLALALRRKVELA